MLSSDESGRYPNLRLVTLGWDVSRKPSFLALVVIVSQGNGLHWLAGQTETGRIVEDKSPRTCLSSYGNSVRSWGSTSRARGALGRPMDPTIRPQSSAWANGGYNFTMSEYRWDVSSLSMLVDLWRLLD